MVQAVQNIVHAGVQVRQPAPPYYDFKLIIIDMLLVAQNDTLILVSAVFQNWIKFLEHGNELKWNVF